ncbi:outer membrane protein assembly factor BamE [Legionella geestiana]|uniref:outer membrane protein assembly factor BamE n=1 Tax=Legionella geestiana TaxID=45065 RepID=UPI00109271DA|nr:outer membrane protein assembly factor BamE [Legionella geestiana]QDQ40312.1 outer membrane protein assembly factor BamE [Legionella geestiana]
MRILSLLLSALVTFSLSGCASYDFARRVVQQGNLIPPSKIERLKVGMSKEDAAILMGTSLLDPTFATDRWDYAFTWRKGSGPMRLRHLTLFFSNGRLARIEHRP